MSFENIVKNWVMETDFSKSFKENDFKEWHNWRYNPYNEKPGMKEIIHKLNG